MPAKKKTKTRPAAKSQPKPNSLRDLMAAKDAQSPPMRAMADYAASTARPKPGKPHASCC